MIIALLYDNINITRRTKEVSIMEKIIGYFFDEDEMELVPMYATLVRLGLASLVISVLVIML